MFIPMLPKENVCAPSWPPNVPNMEGLIQKLLLNPAQPCDSSSVCLEGIGNGQGMQGQQERAGESRRAEPTRRINAWRWCRTLRDFTSSICKEGLRSSQQPPEAQEAFTAKSLVRQWLGTQTSTSGSKVLGKYCPALHTRSFVGQPALKTFLFSPK